MAQNGTLVVDNSILAATAKCDTYSFVRYGCGLATRADSLALAAGSAVHLGLAAWLRGEGQEQAVKVCAEDYEAAVDRYLRHIRSDSLPAADKRFEPAWVEGILDQYLTRYADKWPFKPIGAATEKPIHAPFPIELKSGKKVQYVARLDGMVRRWESGGKWSLDWKTTKRVSDWWSDKQKVSSQFTGQDWLQRQVGNEELQGVVVAAIEIPEPHKSDKKCKDHQVSYQECSIRHAGSDFIYITRHDAEREAWFYTASNLIRRFERLQGRAGTDGIEAVTEVQMTGRFNDSCTFCEMKEWCRLGRPTREANVRATFVEDRWDPMRQE